MPVFLLKCPDCEHQFKGLVLDGTEQPKEWVCSKCGSHQAQTIGQIEQAHPLEESHGKGCPCCNG